MTALGIALLVGGAALVVAEAHVPGGVLGVAGAVALLAGVVVLVPALGGSALVAVPVAAALALAAGAWALLAVRPAAQAQRQRIRAGAEALCGHHGVVRTWECARGPRVRRRRPVARPRRLRARRRAAARGRRRRRGGRARADAQRPARRRMGAERMTVTLRRRRARSACWRPGVALAAASVRVLREYERGVVFRLGRVTDQRGPGLVLLIPAVDRMVRVSLRTVTLKVPAQEVITRDNVPGARDRRRLLPDRRPGAVGLEIETVLAATSQIAQTTLRSVLGKAELDALLAERESAQRAAAADHRRPDRAVGREGHRGRDQGRRDPRAHAARDRPPGRGRARAAREDHQRRGRGPGRRPAEPTPPTSSRATR